MSTKIIQRAAAIASVIMFGVPLIKAAFRGGVDFHVLYLAGQRLLLGAPLYVVSDGWMPYKYHPVWSIPFTVFSLLPERTAFVAFDIAMLVCWVWGANIWARRIGHDLYDPVKYLLLFSVSYNALSCELNLGQTNGLLFLGAAKIFEWLDGKPRWFAAGFLVAVLVSIKLSFGILAVFCLLRNFRTLLGMLAGGVVLYLVTACVFGDWLSLELYRQWMEVLLGQSAQQYADPDVQGVLRFWISVSGADTSQLLWILTVVAAVAFGVYLERNRRNDTILIGGYWMTAIYLLSPLAWWNQILFSLPLAFCLLRKQDLAPLNRWLICTALFCYAAASPTLLGRAGIEAFRNYNGFFLACIAIVAIAVAYVCNNGAREAKLDDVQASGTLAPAVSRTKRKGVREIRN